MKSSLISLAAVSVLVLSGCSQKNPEIDASANETVIETTDASNGSGVDANAQSTDQLISNIKSQLGAVYFGFDQYGIRSDMRSVVSNDAQLLNGADVSKLSIKLEGNCDEFGTDEYNMALGLKRAQSVKKALVSQGVSDGRIQTISYGKNNPVCNEKTKLCWAKNRRVDFDLLP